MPSRDAIVVAAGVIGATSALRLLESGWRVRLWADAFVQGTTSAVAAAIWHPYRTAPEDKVLAWGMRTAEGLRRPRRCPRRWRRDAARRRAVARSSKASSTP